jgi:hypothetical protein
MGQIVRLADRRRRSATRRTSHAPLGARAYYCTHCDGDRFMLYPGGAVQCVCCSAQMENLRVSGRDAPGSEPAAS